MRELTVLHAASRTPQVAATGVKGVMYGKEIAPQAILVARPILEKVYNEAGQNTVIDVLVDDAGKPQKALFQEVQFHPVTGQIIHFDLHAVSLKDKVQAEVPLNIVGESELIIHNEGILTTVQDTVEVEAEPLSLPESYSIDISTIRAVNDSITVADLPILEGVTVLSPPENVLVKIDAVVEQTIEEEEPVEGATEGEGAESATTEGEDSSESADESASSE